MKTSESFSLEAKTILESLNHSVARVALHGCNRPIVNYRSDMVYTVLDGTGVVEIDFTVTELAPGSVFGVPAGTPYQDEAYPGGMVLEAVATPPFNSADIVYLDEPAADS